MRIQLALVSILAASGCTHGMHRAFQATMTVAAVGADACSVLQTRAVLRAPGGVGRETNFMLGADPSDARLAGAFGVNAALISAAALVPLGDDDVAMGDWLRDGFLLTAVVAYGFMAYNDNTVTGDPHRCGVREPVSRYSHLVVARTPAMRVVRYSTSSSMRSTRPIDISR